MPLDPALTEFTTASPSIASYNYTDIESGTGVVIFNFCAHMEGATLAYFLTNQTPYSNRTTISETIVSDSKTSDDFDFDVTFNTPKDLKGNVYVSLPMKVEGNSDSGSAYVTAYVRHWDGTTETEIANAVSETIVKPGVGAVTDVTKLIEIPITTQKHFRKGETLRITLTLFVSAVNGTTTLLVGTDPANRTVADMISTKGTVDAPFVLNI